MRVIADGNNIIELHRLELVYMLRRLGGDIHPGFAHDFDGMRVEAVGFDAGGVDFDLVAL